MQLLRADVLPKLYTSATHHSLSLILTFLSNIRRNNFP